MLLLEFEGHEAMLAEAVVDCEGGLAVLGFFRCEKLGEPGDVVGVVEAGVRSSSVVEADAAKLLREGAAGVGVEVQEMLGDVDPAPIIGRQRKALSFAFGMQELAEVERRVGGEGEGCCRSTLLFLLEPVVDSAQNDVQGRGVVDVFLFNARQLATERREHGPFGRLHKAAKGRSQGPGPQIHYDDGELDDLVARDVRFVAGAFEIDDAQDLRTLAEVEERGL
mmetsp:Transcript_16551/g.53903  ORF Transcript_16551/g.53903 Transcript_16551/m.53903 type:complete len:223 (-) Transcript_16551:275-943(-)